jgi:hypothetical protein
VAAAEPVIVLMVVLVEEVIVQVPNTVVEEQLAQQLLDLHLDKVKVDLLLLALITLVVAEQDYMEVTQSKVTTAVAVVLVMQTLHY